ncbi:MAG: hypothetical protein EPO07_03005 [Verrucomicrobia bacterium]|nr:MAG: hypothetical protein EPO07_03005 [Verrucomicrobiota bacterium]
MMFRLRLWFWCVLTAICFSAAAAWMKPLSVEELAQAADVVLHGTVVSKTVQRDAEGRIYTSVEFNIREVWKGKISRKDFRLVYGGGILGEEHATSSAQVEYEIGEEVVAYLRLTPQGNGVTLGLVQGKFHVATDAKTREKHVFNPFNGKPDTGDDRTTGRLKLADLKQRTVRSGQ